MEVQDPETPAEQEETPTQEEQPQEQESEELETEEEPSDGEDQEDNPQEEEEEAPSQQEQPPEQVPAGDDTAALRNQLLNAQGRLAAYAAGVSPGMVDDAVTLAMAEAARSGEVTETSVNAAMDAVLKRHPEWKADNGRKKTGGFKIGADRDNASSGKATETTPKNMKRWNRFK